MDIRSFKQVMEQYGSIAHRRQPVRALLQKEMTAHPYKIVVLDDDPTGVQTVHHINVYTDWSLDAIREGFLEDNCMFYILTNSRAMTAAETTKVHSEIAERVNRVSEETGQPCLLVSRSDSTLRGHYPLELEVIRTTWETMNAKMPDGEILIPFFEAGGRYTIEDIHYVRYGDKLVPAGDTEFAADRTFGYTSSDLKDYIEEKTKGTYPAKRVTSISLESLRKEAYDQITQQLMEVHDSGKVIVNAIEPIDLEVFSVCLYRAMAMGRYFLFRTAADFVKAVGAIADQPLLSGEQLNMSSGKTGGVVIIGSHTAKTTQQLEGLRHRSGIRFIEFDSDLVLVDGLDEEVKRVVSEIEDVITSGLTAVVYTKRKLLVVEHDTKEQALERSVEISTAVTKLIENLKIRPAFVVAKGGITSSDIGVKGLGVKKAFVPGQILPGIPVWKTGEESHFPGIPYVIFPGNVGEADSLDKIMEKLMGGTT